MAVYSANGWEGKNYQPYLSGKEIAQKVRQFIKEDTELKACKWSVVADVDMLTIALMSAPFEVFADEAYKRTGYMQNADLGRLVTPECFKVVSKVKAFVLSFVREDSDAMTDYFDRNIYDFYEIGKWNKPFAQTN